ncbi:putative D,D-heptose 1,7-bisphosphate phosphatase [uncultured delta proteobacterium]|uniref:D,D-heptose 1,7-bisphosphate phosphatase n=1 Tax=uncultured delta proteobacterium TaxID=34034 RepID=A0A212KGN1_9DELT|nr:putative D,D-heptose 1,7-bisphosphate phosphatase [uncultured delta proteobacterium]
MTCKAVFLDRDGVLNVAVIRNGKSFPPADAASLVLTPGAKEAIERMRRAGYLCICVTNQPDVARGSRTLENVAAMNEKVAAALALDDLFMCTHDNDDHCACRKPKPGMLLDAAAKWGINLRASIMIGDRASDMEAGFAAGCQTVFIPNPEILGQKIPSFTVVCKTLTDAAEYVAMSGNKENVL